MKKILFPLLFLIIFTLSIPNTLNAGAPSSNPESGAPSSNPEIVIPSKTGLPDPDPNGTGGDGIQTILTNFTSWLLTIFLILAVLSFVITGVMYLISLGDARSQTIDNAKQNFKYSIIAVVTVGVSYIIIQFIDNLLQGTL
jgi:hypothetical protein